MLRLGIASPAVTGLLYGCFCAVRPLLMLTDHISLFLEPAFDCEVLEGRCRSELQISYMIVIPILMIRLMMSLGVWQAKRHGSHYNRGAPE